MTQRYSCNIIPSYLAVSSTSGRHCIDQRLSPGLQQWVGENSPASNKLLVLPQQNILLQVPTAGPLHPIFYFFFTFQRKHKHCSELHAPCDAQIQLRCHLPPEGTQNVGKWPFLLLKKCIWEHWWLRAVVTFQFLSSVEDWDPWLPENEVVWWCKDWPKKSVGIVPLLRKNCNIELQCSLPNNKLVFDPQCCSTAEWCDSYPIETNPLALLNDCIWPTQNKNFADAITEAAVEASSMQLAYFEAEGGKIEKVQKSTQFFGYFLVIRFRRVISTLYNCFSTLANCFLLFPRGNIQAPCKEHTGGGLCGIQKEAGWSALRSTRERQEGSGGAV